MAHIRLGSHSRITKVGDAVSCRMCLSFGWRLDYTVLRALDGIVRPAREEVGRIDNNGTFDRSGIDEVAVGAEHLETTSHVLEQQRYGACSLSVSAT
jgi:hypothetical protein